MNISYIRLLQAIESFASSHLQIQKFASDFPSQMPNFATGNEAYPILFVSPTTSIFDENTTTFEVDVYCFDIIQKDRGNINTILSDTNLILSDLSRWFRDNDDIFIEMISSSATPIDNALLDYAAGWVMRIVFEVSTYGVCEIPFAEPPTVVTEVNDIVYSRWLTCETLGDCPVITDIQDQLSGLTGSTGEYLPLSGGTMYSGASIFFNNNTKISEGIVDAGTGGNKGIALTCAVGYEWKWEAGEAYLTNLNFNYIDVKQYARTTPTVNDDISKGFIVGTNWFMLDGSRYVCSDSTIGSAVWEQVIYVPNLQDVTTVGSITTNSMTVESDFSNTIIETSGVTTTDFGTNEFTSVRPTGVFITNNSSMGLGLSGTTGIGLNSEDYQWKFENGEIFLYDVVNNFIVVKDYSNTIPSSTDDLSKGYVSGSIWKIEGQTYQCTDPTIGAAVWEQIVNFGDLQLVTDNGNTTTNSITADGGFYSNFDTGSLISDDIQFTYVNNRIIDDLDKYVNFIASAENGFSISSINFTNNGNTALSLKENQGAHFTVIQDSITNNFNISSTETFTNKTFNVQVEGDPGILIKTPAEDNFTSIFTGGLNFTTPQKLLDITPNYLFYSDVNTANYKQIFFGDVTETTQQYYFPDKPTGTYTLATIDDFSNLVPYTGATDNVNLYPYNLTVSAITTDNLKINGTLGQGFIELQSQNGAPTTGTGVRLYSDNLGYPSFKDSNGKVVSFQTNLISSNVDLTIPNSSGIIALTNNVVNSINAISPITRTTGITPTISTSMNTNRLIGRFSAGTGVMQEISIGSGLTLTNAGVLNNTATPTPVGYYGAWQDLVTQTAATSNIGYPIIYRTVEFENQVRVVSNGTNPTRITFDNTGVYNLQFSVQLQNIGNSNSDVTIWLRKNGVDVDGSSGYAIVPQRKSAGVGNEGRVIVGWNYLLSVVGGDYFELVWSTSNASDVTIQYYPGSNPPPAAASVILTVTQQSGIMSGTGLTAINNLTTAVQTITTGTTGTDFNITSSGGTHTFNLPTASATNRGVLSSTDWKNFNDIVLISDGIPGTPFTGGTSNTRTLVKSYLIPANTFASGDTFEVWAIGSKVNTNSSWFVSLNVNTSNSIVGATEIGRSFSNNASIIYMPFQRIYNFTTSTNLRGSTSNSGSVIESSLNSASSNTTFNTAVDNWIIFAITPATGGTADIFNIEKVIIRKMKYRITV